MKTPGCGDQRSFTKQLLLRRRQGGGCAGIGADHLDHGVIVALAMSIEIEMESAQERVQSRERRQRLHELLLALIAQQGDLELMDGEGPVGITAGSSTEAPADAARWLDRNRRVLQRYQALVRTAVTLDALLDGEQA
jgi:hypothetical protein